MILLSSNTHQSGRPIQAAFKDVRQVTEIELLKQLDKADVIYPQSSSLMNQNEEASGNQRIEELILAFDDKSINNFVKTEERHVMNEVADFTPVQNRDTENNALNLSPEIQKWSEYPTTTALLCRQRGQNVNEPRRDVSPTIAAHEYASYYIHLQSQLDK